MPGTTPNNGFRYPLATEAPDGPGAFLQLATDVDNAVDDGTWTPQLGGSGATLGTGGTATGHHGRVGTQTVLQGRLAFGSGGSFGTGTPTLLGSPSSYDTRWAWGTGIYIPVTGNPVPFAFTPFGSSPTSQWIIRVLQNGAYPFAWSYGTPAQSDLLLFTINGAS